MKTLAVIIAHPLRKVSGATNAGRELSLATAGLIDMELAIMWDRDETVEMGPLKVRHMNATTPLDWAGTIVPRFARVPLYQSRIPDLVRTGEYDLVHIHNMVPTFAAESVAVACRQAGVPYVISTHGFYEVQRYAELNGFGRIKSGLIDYSMTRPFRRTVSGAAALFALSDCEIPSLMNLGVPRDKIFVVTNGVNEFYLQPSTEGELAAVRAKYGLGNKPILLFMGSLHAYKGVDVFLRSLNSITGEFQAVVAGAFKSEEEKQDLIERTAIPAEVLRRLVFTGRVTNEELRALYCSASMLIYPTQGDTLPLVVLEAMACGRPVISTTIGGIPFAVKPETGILVEPNRPEAVALAANELLQDEARRARMGRLGRRRIEDVFRWRQSAARSVDYYRQVLCGNTHRTSAMTAKVL